MGVGGLCKLYVTRCKADDSIGSVAEAIGKCHDLGKYTQFFQDHLAKKTVPGDLSNHSRLSATLASWVVYKRFRDPFLSAQAFVCVDSHHGHLKSYESLRELVRLGQFPGSLFPKQVASLKKYLGSISAELEEIGLPEAVEFISSTEACLPELLETLKKGMGRILWMGEEEKWSAYYSTLLLFSCLIDADKRDAGKVGAHSLHGGLGADLVASYIRKRFDSPSSGLDEIRSALFTNTDRRLEEVLKGDVPRVLTIKAPTGIGKTLLGLHVALRLRERLGRSRVIYCLPYINIIEQVHRTAEDVLTTYYGKSPGVDMLLKYHHLFFPKQEGDDVPLDKLLLLTDSWESDLIITTFEQLLRSLVGCRNAALKKFHNIVDSVLILDEIQAIPLEYWRLIREIIQHLIASFDIGIVLMSATIPAIFSGTEIVPEPQEYFKRVDRTVLMPHLDGRVTPEGFADYFLSRWDGKASALLVLNTIRTSKMVYNRIAERLGVQRIGRLPSSAIFESKKPVLAYLSTSVIPKERMSRVNLLKRLLEQRRSVILVSTQVVEAGVDLDFDMVFRDLGPLDSVIQVTGRCNRNWRLKEGQAHVLEVADEQGRSDSKKIYGKILPECSRRFVGQFKSIREREFAGIVESYYEDVSYRMNVERDPESMEVLERIKALEFRELCGFSLIKEEPKIPVYVELDSDGKKILDEFKTALKGFEDAKSLEEVFEQRAALRKIRAEMENYIVEVYEREEGLRRLHPIMSNIGILHVPHGEVSAFYDLETGFRSASGEENDLILI